MRQCGKNLEVQENQAGGSSILLQWQGGLGRGGSGQKAGPSSHCLMALYATSSSELTERLPKQ